MLFFDLHLFFMAELFSKLELFDNKLSSKLIPHVCSKDLFIILRASLVDSFKAFLLRIFFSSFAAYPGFSIHSFLYLLVVEGNIPRPTNFGHCK